MAPSVIASLRSPVTVLLACLSCLLSVCAVWFSHSFDLSFETAFLAFIPALSLFAPFVGAVSFVSMHQAGRTCLTSLFTVALVPALSLAIPITFIEPTSGVAFSSLFVFFSRALFSASLSFYLTRITSRPMVSALIGFAGSVAGWVFLSSLADRAFLPVGGFVSASQGLLPVAETLAGIIASLACMKDFFLGYRPLRVIPHSWLFLGALIISLSCIHFDLSLDRRSSVSEQSSALLSRLDSELLFTLYDTKDGFLSPGQRARIRHLLSGYARKGKGLFHHEEVSTPSGSLAARNPIAEYRGSFRDLPPLDTPMSFEHDLCVSIADLLGDDVIPEVSFVSTTEDSRSEYAKSELLRRGVRVIPGEIPDSPAAGRVLIIYGITRGDVSRLRDYLDAGGAAIFLVSGVVCDAYSSWKVYPKRGDPLIELLSEYGITPAPNLLESPRGTLLRMPALDGSSIITTRYPFWVTAVPKGNRQGFDDPNILRILSGVEQATFLWPSPLDVTERLGVRSRVILVAEAGARLHATPVDAHPFANTETRPVSETLAEDVPVLVSLAIGNNAESVIVLSDEYALDRAGTFADTSATQTLLLNAIEYLSGKDDYLILRRRGGS